MSTDWGDARVEQLKTLWADGYSGSQIAAKLGNVSRNAVIAKVHRLGLAHRASSSPRTRRPAPRPRPAVSGPVTDRARDENGRIVGLPLPGAQAEDIPRVSVVDVERHHCRFACADPEITGAFLPLFCGATRLPNLPYCQAHAARCYATPAHVRHEHALGPALDMEVAAA